MKYDKDVVLEYYRDHGVELEPEVQFDDERKWRFDFCNRDSMVAIECQGGLFIGGRHSRGAGALEDMLKFNTAQALGWRILLTSPADLCMSDTLEMVKRLMEVNSGKGRIKGRGSKS
jgi:hypothetical protein